MMNSNTTPSANTNEVFSPSRTVWRTQMAKGTYPPHRMSRITCIVDNLLAPKVTKTLAELGIDNYIETGRVVRENIKKRPFNLPGNIVTLQSSPVSVIRFTVPRAKAKDVMGAIIYCCDLATLGHGSIFAQDLMEFSHDDPTLNLAALDAMPKNTEVNMLNKLSCITCVLSIPGSGEQLAKIALDLGICVPVLTSGTGNDIRDQLGLIRITIPAEKEIVSIVMPEQDSNSIIRLLSEQAKLDKTGRGFIYQTPVSIGLMDTRMKMGVQTSAASIEQIIAAIDSLKGGTNWRRRLDYSDVETNSSALPQDNCEVTITSDEDRIDALREACLKVGAKGAITTNVIPQINTGENTHKTMIRSAINIPATQADSVVNNLLDITSIKTDNTDKICVLDSPAAYRAK